MKAFLFRLRPMAMPLSLMALALGSGPAAPAIDSAPVESPVVISNLTWVRWSSATVGAAGAAQGSLTISNLTSLNVLYEGEVSPGTQIGGDINFWSPGTPYLSLTISNLPPFNDFIAVPDEAEAPSRITFSEPVDDPVFLFAGLGSAGLPTSLHFNAPFSILSQGPGYWGPGELSSSEDDQTLIGLEGHGAIQFTGRFSTIEWLLDGSAAEFHGFTLGVPVEPDAALIPESSPARAVVMTLLLTAGGEALRRRRRRRGDSFEPAPPGRG